MDFGYFAHLSPMAAAERSVFSVLKPLRVIAPPGPASEAAL